MTEEWRIVYFKTRGGGLPVYNFIEELNPIAKSKIINTFDLLIQYGINLGSPHVKKLVGTELWELRILGKDSIRIFYIAISGRILLLLHGFVKKIHKTPKKELKIAVSRLKEYKSR